MYLVNAGWSLFYKMKSMIHWSRRVSPGKIRRLYESDANGMLDEELMVEVGYGTTQRGH